MHFLGQAFRMKKVKFCLAFLDLKKSPVPWKTPSITKTGKKTVRKQPESQNLKKVKLVTLLLGAGMHLGCTEP